MLATRTFSTCFRTLSVAGTLFAAISGLAQAPSPRTDHTAVWTGTELIVWGGRGSNGVLQSGARYNPRTHTWAAISPAGAPLARQNHSAIWTGSTMLVWGGFDYSSGNYFNDGACYNPATDTWSAMPNPGNPSPRANHTVVWTGSQQIVWGGASNSVSLGEIYLSSGASFLPSLNSWLGNVTNNSPNPRVGHTAVWTGSQMIVWGGVDDDGVNDPDKANTGGRYNPATEVWLPTTTNAAPTNRTEHTAVWTGSQMIVWGGLGNGAYDFLNSGSRYDPGTDSWLPTTLTGAPSIRQLHTAVWTGSEMIIFGGRAASNFRNNGGRYNPATDSWSATTTSGAPSPRAGHTAVWTGSEMIVFGGETGPGVFSSSVGRYHPALNVWTIPAVCALTSPAPAANLPGGTSPLLSATASDPDGAVQLVEFFANGALIGSRNTPTSGVYTCTWNLPAAGAHALTVVATDNLGVKATSAVVNVTIGVTGTPPSVALTAPQHNSQLVAHEPFALLASASDADGTVTSVSFLVDGTPVGSAVTAPFQVNWPSPSLGFHLVTAVATDNSGLSATSAPVSLEAVLKPRLNITAGLTNYLIELTGGETGRVYHVEFSTDLATWLPLSTNVATNGTLTINDLVSPGLSHRFYRALP